MKRYLVVALFSLSAFGQNKPQITIGAKELSNLAGFYDGFGTSTSSVLQSPTDDLHLGAVPAQGTQRRFLIEAIEGALIVQLQKKTGRFGHDVWLTRLAVQEAEKFNLINKRKLERDFASKTNPEKKKILMAQKTEANIRFSLAQMGVADDEVAVTTLLGHAAGQLGMAPVDMLQGLLGIDEDEVTNFYANHGKTVKEENPFNESAMQAILKDITDGASGAKLQGLVQKRNADLKKLLDYTNAAPRTDAEIQAFARANFSLTADDVKFLNSGDTTKEELVTDYIRSILHASDDLKELVTLGPIDETDEEILNHFFGGEGSEWRHPVTHKKLPQLVLKRLANHILTTLSTGGEVTLANWPAIESAIYKNAGSLANYYNKLSGVHAALTNEDNKYHTEPAVEGCACFGMGKKSQLPWEKLAQSAEKLEVVLTQANKVAQKQGKLFLADVGAHAHAEVVQVDPMTVPAVAEQFWASDANRSDDFRQFVKAHSYFGPIETNAQKYLKEFQDYLTFLMNIDDTLPTAAKAEGDIRDFMSLSKQLRPSAYLNHWVAAKLQMYHLNLRSKFTDEQWSEAYADILQKKQKSKAFDLSSLFTSSSPAASFKKGPAAPHPIFSVYNLHQISGDNYRCWMRSGWFLLFDHFANNLAARANFRAVITGLQGNPAHAAEDAIVAEFLAALDDILDSDNYRLDEYGRYDALIEAALPIITERALLDPALFGGAAGAAPDRAAISSQISDLQSAGYNEIAVTASLANRFGTSFNLISPFAFSPVAEQIREIRSNGDPRYVIHHNGGHFEILELRPDAPAVVPVGAVAAAAVTPAATTDVHAFTPVTLPTIPAAVAAVDHAASPSSTPVASPKLKVLKAGSDSEESEESDSTHTPLSFGSDNEGFDMDSEDDDLALAEALRLSLEGLEK